MLHYENVHLVLWSEGSRNQKTKPAIEIFLTFVQTIAVF